MLRADLATSGKGVGVSVGNIGNACTQTRIMHAMNRRLGGGEPYSWEDEVGGGA